MTKRRFSTIAVALLLVGASFTEAADAPSYEQLRAAFSSPDHARWGEVPLWWWEGDPLRREVVTWQLETLAAKGIKSVCPIQRSPGRCQPASFSPEWWEMFSFVAKECRRLGMTLWAYDQVGYGNYGWLEKAAAKAQDRRTSRLVFRTVQGAGPLRLDLPEGRLVGARAYPLPDGQADDAASIDLSEQVHGRQLRWTPPAGTWRVAASVAVPALAFHLSDKAADTFIDMLYGEIERRLGAEAMGTTFVGMFQDEHPATPRDIYTERLAETFRQRTGYELARAIPALHFDVGPLTPKYRLDFFDAYLAVDEACYWRRIYDWTTKRGLLTSHDNWGRNNIARQSQGYIDYFRTQRWFSAPGYDDAGIKPIDGRNYYDTKIAASIARLYGRRRVWVEAFHSSGWGRTTEQTLAWLSANYAFGANLYDEHGLYYAVRASTWEHAAPDPHWRQPYWCYYGTLSDWVARMSYLMSQGTHVVDVAVHYPVVSVLAGPPPGAKAPDYNRYMRLSRSIYDAGIDNDIIDDDSILAAQIKDGKLVVANNGYQALVFGPEPTVRLSVLEKARRFAESGGTVIFFGACPTATVENGRADPAVARCIEQLVGRDHPGGGFSALVPSDRAELVRLVGSHIERDFRAETDDLFVAHRRVNEVDVYLVQHAAEGPVDLDAAFRADGVPELWDPATGKVLPVDSYERSGGTTRVRQKLAGNTAYLFVLRPGDRQKSAGAGGSAAPPEREIRLAEDWDFSVLPTRDNRWGEFRWPPSAEKIGPEVRSFRYAEETARPGTELGWQRPDFDDSAWPTARYSIGPYWLLAGDVPAGADLAATVLAAEKEIRLGAKVKIGDKALVWRPVEFSKTIGLARPMPWGGHSGYPDGAIDRNFIDLPKGRKFLFTRIRSPKDQRLGLRIALRNSGARLWVGGVEQPLEDAVGNLPLVKGENTVLVELPDGGRGMLYVQAQPPSVRSLAEAARGGVAPDLAAAKWIRDQSTGAGYVRKTFHLDQVPREARLVVTAYTGYRLLLNGVNVEEDIGPWAKWTQPESINVAAHLRKGKNVIAAWVQVFSGQNVHAVPEQKGFVLALAARDADGRTWQLLSDGSWKGARTEQPGWAGPDFDDTSWQPVRVLGPMGAEPWGAEPLKHIGSASEPRRPLAVDLPSPYLTCFDEVPGIAYDVKPAGDRRVGWYRFKAPPGLRRLKLNTPAAAQVWVDGKPAAVQNGYARPAAPPAGVSTVAVRLEMQPGAYAGAALPVPFGVELGGGKIQPGLWAEFGLPTYSGIGVYRQEVELAAEAGWRTILDLGQVLVAAEVRVNGQSAGVRLARPFQFDLTKHLKPGRNTIEVRVANTIAPHYTVTNQVKNLGATDSGLLGPVVLKQRPRRAP